jgi:hypothetical protein
MDEKWLEYRPGRLVEIIDSGGDSIGQKGDQGRILGYDVGGLIMDNGTPTVQVKLITGKDTGKTSSRFIYRYKLLSEDWDT